MDFIYGKLNKQVVPVNYDGLTSDTSTTVVNNTDRTIKVNVDFSRDNPNNPVQSIWNAIDSIQDMIPSGTTESNPLVNKNYLDALIGDIDIALQVLDTGEGVNNSNVNS